MALSIWQREEVRSAQSWCEVALRALTSHRYLYTNSGLLDLRDGLVIETERLVNCLGIDGVRHPAFSECQYMITEIDAATGYGH